MNQCSVLLKDDELAHHDIYKAAAAVIALDNGEKTGGNKQ